MMSAPEMTAPSVTPVRWYPTWAKVVAIALLVLAVPMTLFGGFALGSFMANSTQPFSEIGLFFGAFTLVPGLLVGAPMVVFLVRKGKASFITGLVMLALSVLAMSAFFGIAVMVFSAFQ